MTLAFMAGDSQGNEVELYVPLINGGFQLNGTASFAPGETSEPLSGVMVGSCGLHLGYNVTTTLDAGGVFTVDNLPADNYTADVVTPGGSLFGTESFEFDGSVSTGSMTLNLLAGLSFLGG